MNRKLRFLAIAACAAAIGCPKPAKPPKPSYDGPAIEKSSRAKERREVALTVYNEDFGLVREVRELSLGTGRVELAFRDVPSRVQPATVNVKSLTASDAITLFEQNYRYDLLSPEKLLEKYVGKKVKVYRWNEKLGKDEPFDAEVLSVHDGTVLRVGGEITAGFPGRITFPEVPSNLIAEPSLVWLLGSAVEKQKIEVSYLTSGITWQCDYVMVLDDKDQSADLQGWVTLKNHTGAGYEDAKLKLVAGDVHRAEAERDLEGFADDLRMAEKDEPAPAFKEEGLFEYHLYTLGRPTTILDNEQKQLSLLEAQGVKVEKKLIFFGDAYRYRSKWGEVTSNQKVGVYLDLKNDEKSKLGMPLPKGIVRVYKADASGAKQFVGEDRIDHTPRDEKIRIKMGEAFDVVADRKQTDWKSLGTCNSESGWEISVRNHKDVDEQVIVNEPIGGDWTILSETHPHVKQDAHTFSFDVKVPKRGETKIKYRVRIKWC